MAELAELVDPRHTAVVTMEMQRGISGDLATLPALAQELRDRGVVDACASVCRAARTAGLEEGAEPRIAETLVTLLEKVSGKPRREMIPAPGPAVTAALALKPWAYWRLDEPESGTLADATGIVVARGPAIVSRAGLAYDATVDDGAKITTKIGQLAAAGIVARDGV